MTAYRRLYIPGGTFFFTVRLADRRSDLLVRRIALLRDCFAAAQARWPFSIDAAVVLPDHLHMIWTLPVDDADFSARWRLIKATFSRHVDAPAHLSPSLALRGEKGIWQRRFWEHAITDPADFDAHHRLILQAPVQAGLVARVQDWPYASVHRDLRRGVVLPTGAAAGFGGSDGSRPILQARAG